jgi:hypothetical protein
MDAVTRQLRKFDPQLPAVNCLTVIKCESGVGFSIGKYSLFLCVHQGLLGVLCG